MNLKAYYQKIRELEQTLVEGVFIEAPASLAAKMIADGRAHLASSEEARSFRQKVADAKRAADDEATASKMQVTIVPTAELRKTNRPGKE